MKKSTVSCVEEKAYMLRSALTVTLQVRTLELIKTRHVTFRMSHGRSIASSYLSSKKRILASQKLLPA